MTQKMVEVDEQTAELGKLAQRLRLGKKTAKPFMKLVAEEDPELRIPELEAEAEIETRMKPVLEENKALRDRLDKRDAFDALEERRAPAYARGYKKGSKELKDLEQFMIDKKIGDYELAIDNFERAKQLAAPKQGGRSWDRPQMPDADNKDLYKDPRGYASSLAHRLIDESIAGKPIA